MVSVLIPPWRPRLCNWPVVDALAHLACRQAVNFVSSALKLRARQERLLLRLMSTPIGAAIVVRHWYARNQARLLAFISGVALSCACCASQLRFTLHVSTSTGASLAIMKANGSDLALYRALLFAAPPTMCDMHIGGVALRDAIARRALQPSLPRCPGHSVAGTGAVLCVSLSPN